MVKDDASANILCSSEGGIANTLAPGHTDDEASDEEGPGTQDEFGDETTRGTSGESASRQIAG